MKTFSPEEWENVPSNNNTLQVENNNTSRMTSAYSNISEDTRAKIERLVSLIEQKGIDITNGYYNWLKVGFALTSAAEASSIVSVGRILSITPVIQTSTTINVCLHMGMAYLSPHSFRWRKMLVLTFPIPKKSKSLSLELWIFGLLVLATKYPKNQISNLSKWTSDGF